MPILTNLFKQKEEVTSPEPDKEINLLEEKLRKK